MRPRGMPSRRVKVLPWYYAERKQPTRAAEVADALGYEAVAGGTALPLEGELRAAIECVLIDHAGELGRDPLHGAHADANLSELAHVYEQLTGWTVEQELAAGQ